MLIVQVLNRINKMIHNALKSVYRYIHSARSILILEYSTMFFSFCSFQEVKNE